MNAIDILHDAGFSQAHGTITSTAEHYAARMLADEGAGAALLVRAVANLDRDTANALDGFSRACAETDRVRRSGFEAGTKQAERAEGHALETLEARLEPPASELRRRLLARLEALGVVPPGGRSPTESGAFLCLDMAIREARTFRRVMENNRAGRGGMAKAVPALLAERTAWLARYGIAAF